jgi:hypothetical protein
VSLEHVKQLRTRRYKMRASSSRSLFDFGGAKVDLWGDQRQLLELRSCRKWRLKINSDAGNFCGQFRSGFKES